MRLRIVLGPNINELVLFQVEQILWEVSDEVRASRLRSFKNQFFTYQNPRIRIQLRFHNFFGPNNELVSFQVEQVLWEVSDEVRASRLRRFVVPREEQSNFESEKLWSKVSEAIAKDDQVFFFFRPSTGLSSLHGLLWSGGVGPFQGLLLPTCSAFCSFSLFLSQQSLLHRKERKEMEERQQLAPVYEFFIEILVFEFM